MLRSRTDAARGAARACTCPTRSSAATDGVDPEHEALLADSVGLALLVVLETLAPAERLAFVLHDMFAVPFDEIAAIVERSPAAARQLASRARRRVQGAAPVPDADLARQREVVDAFFAAARDGDFEALVAVLDPDVVLRSDGGALRPERHGVVRGARGGGRRGRSASRASRRSSGRRSSTAPPASSWRPHGRAVLGHGLHGRAAGGSSRSTRSPTPQRLRRLDLAVLDD